MKMRTLLLTVLLGTVLVLSEAAAAGTAESGTDTNPETSESQNLVIYAYDSFVSDWGPGPQVIPLFEEATGITVDLVSAGDAGQVLSRAIIEKDDPQADIILGIDNNLLHQAKAAGILEAYTPEGIEVIRPELLFDADSYITPFDYGYFSVIYDSEKIIIPPATLEDLTKAEYKDSLILMDPRTSSPGLGFLFWTIKVYGDDYLAYWERLSPSILTITDGWDSGYGLFTNGEAPMVISYTTSPPYHVEYEETTRYQAAIFNEGNYLQIEGVGIVKGGPNRAAAETFMDFMLTIPFQDALPLTNFMYPINKEVVLPGSFDYAPQPETILSLDPDYISANREKLIQDWVELMGTLK
ncbi:MAG: thiamine ABC transporter substrate-binding protein [Spirochaetales bacterium]|nr:thiamine ABC transporter substrate-binding protein [Spirochaetales bacterium]